MDAEIVTLINSGVTTLLGLMVTDAWGKTKNAAIALFGRRENDDSATVGADLESSRERLQVAVSQGDSQVEAELVAEWRSRLRRAVENDSHRLELLRDFVEKNSQIVSGYSTNAGHISIQAQAYDNSRVYQQGSGTQFNH